MTSRFLLAFFLACAPVPSFAMNLNLARPYTVECSPPQTPQLAFSSPQSETLLFEKGQEITMLCQAGTRAIGLSWSLHRNRVKKPFLEGQAEALPANQFKIRLPTGQLEPGFYDLRVKLDNGVDPLVEGVSTFGWQVSSMALRETRPADFSAFWKALVDAYAAAPLDVRMESEMKTYRGKEIGEYNAKEAALPGDYDPNGHKFDEVESCKISYAGPDGGRVYGWLARPKGGGPFPGMIVLPGAGFNARPRPLEHARHGFVALDIQIHGQDVDLEKYEKLPGYYNQFTYEPPQDYYYKNVYLRALKAVEVLTTRPEVKKNEIVVVGGSQGGRLAIVVAALDPRVRAAISCIANSANYPHLRWVADCNGLVSPFGKQLREGGVISDGTALSDAPPAFDDPEARCVRYYDPMNFASDVKCPVLMNAGLIDPVSPPFSIWAVFNRLGTKDRQIVALPGLGHDWSAEFDRRAWHWLEERLKANAGTN